MEGNFTFREVKWYDLPTFTCIVKSVSTNKENRTVKFNLEKLGGRSPKDVQGIEFYSCSLPVFPLNLTKTFPNLTVLQITDCGLTEITKNDLVGLGGLVELHMYNNKLQSLPSDLFSDMKNLKGIYLSNNRIKYLDSKMFDGIKSQLEFLGFCSNVSIDDYWTKRRGTIDEFMRVIDNQCEKPMKYNKAFLQKASKYFNDLWLTRRFSDLTIVMGEVEFKVHKTVLAMQSEVFDALFANELEERKTNQLTISDFSSAAFEDFLSFLYTGKIQGELNAMELFSLAAKYDVADLKTMSEEIILNYVDESNALEVLALGSLHGSEVLMKKSFDLVKRSYPDITFNEGLMKQPEAVKRRIDAKAQLDKAVEKARKKFEKVMKDEV